jgi:hypothetical protein
LEEELRSLKGMNKINRLGRSVTSRLEEHHTQVVYVKGFKVRMDDGNELTVSLKTTLT